MTTGIQTLISTFNLQGGIELGGIYVKTMAPEGPAALSGKINIGALTKSIFSSSSSSSSSSNYYYSLKLLLLLCRNI